jgi:glycine/D-amino acid oxidase-like deaminating enzyme
VTVELEGGSTRAAAVLVATDGPVGDLVPEIQPMLRPAAPARLRASLLAGAVLPGAVRTADGRIAWQGGEGLLLLAATDASPGPPHESLEDFATRIPVDLASLRRWAEPGEVSVDGLPIVGRLPGRPLAVACGFGALSAGLAFAAARWAADAVLSGADSTPDPLRATRPPASV